MLRRHLALNEPYLGDGAPVLIHRLWRGDAALYPDFLGEVTAEALRLRFLAPMREDLIWYMAVAMRRAWPPSTPGIGFRSRSRRARHGAEFLGARHRPG